MERATVGFRRPGESTGSGFGLPGELLQKSRRRVRVVALLVLLAAGVDTVLMVAQLLSWAFGGDAEALPPSALPFAANLVTVGCAVGIALAAGAKRISNTTLLYLGLGFEVVLCMLLSLANPVAVFETTGHLPTMTWVTPLIILFPLIVPCPPRQTALTALAAAATAPLGIAILSATGMVEASGDAYFEASFSPALAVAFAWFGARVVYGLGLQLAESRRMGSYRLETLLGRGGMGEVWVAHHQLLARPAAIKLVRPDLHPGDTGAALQRFEREAQATAALRSPHTIELYDFGTSEDGTFYYVMELLDGLDTDALVRRFGPLPAERAVWVLRQVCHSLAEAHEAGLVHRDIKPANVFLCRYGRDFDFVKVLDFGLVKATSGPAALASEDALSGTPAFMSPEQALGADALDGRSDLYAVGCLAYWLLTGELVFTGRTAVEMLMHHARTPPEPPSLRSENPVPEALEALVLACLAKDPAQRPQSASELAERLAGCLDAARWDAQRARQWWQAHRPASPPGRGSPRPAGPAAPRVSAAPSPGRARTPPA